MPRPIKSPRAKPGSNSPVKPPPKAAPPSPQFTESSQQDSSSGPDRPEKIPDSAERLSPEKLSLDATEPFPPGLFRLPVPNAVFSRMPELSDSALRCLLALIHLSFRFDPAESEWVHTGEWFARSDVEEACGLSGQGTRNGLSELESIGWAEADCSGRSHRYRLKLEVPSRRFTYVPTAFLERASAIGSGTELRVALAVLRGTWGWTCKEKDPEDGSLRAVHDRWAQLSNRALAESTGRSETAVAEAAKALQGRWIERVRPGSGPYQYRFWPEAVGDGLGELDSFCGPTSNDLAPDRQKSGTPTYSKESFSKDKHSQTSKSDHRSQPKASTSATEDAVRADSSSSEDRRPPGQDTPSNSKRQRGSSPDFGDLPPEKQDLAEKLTNVGVWAGQIADLLSRFSCARIEVNFQLYRRRASEQTIRKPGAWLYEAITDGYALPDVQPNQSEEESAGDPGRMDLPNHKETVSEERKDAYVAQGTSEDRFHRCLSPDGSSPEPQFMYFSPEEDGPEQRV